MGIINSIFKAIKPKRVDTSAADAAARSATELQEKIYEETKAREQPLYDIGLSGTQDLASRLGIAGDPEAEGYGGLTQTFGADQFEEDPGYQFRLDEGNQALERRLAAQGKTFSPEAAKELMGYGQGMASQEYGKAFDRYNVGQSNIYNRIAGLSGMGQQAGSQLTSAGQNYAGNVGQTAASLASAKIAGEQSYQGRRQSMFNTLIGGGATAAAAFSDETLKENIVKVGVENGHNIYHFNYKGDDKRFEGVMAQEVIKTNPEAVTTLNGKLAVYYDKLGLKMSEVN